MAAPRQQFSYRQSGTVGAISGSSRSYPQGSSNGRGLKIIDVITAPRPTSRTTMTRVSNPITPPSSAIQPNRAPLPQFTLANQHNQTLPSNDALSLKVPHRNSPAAPIFSDVATYQPTQANPNPASLDTLHLPGDLHIIDAAGQHSTAKKALARVEHGVKFGSLFLGFLGMIVGGAALLNAFVFQSYYVDGLSMQPTLHDNDRLLVSKVERTAATALGEQYIPRRGQIVVIDSKVLTSHNTLQDQQIIKRIIGLPGETVKISHGVVTIYNYDYPEGFEVDKHLQLEVAETFTTTELSITVPVDHVFVLGDNRSEGGSYDSRSFGPIHTEMINGRLMLRLFPLKDANLF